MLDNIIYKFQNRNSKKNLKKKIEELEKNFHNLRKDTLGRDSSGWISFDVYSINGNSVRKKADESLNGRINEILDYLGVEYAESKLVPKPKEKE